jgi:hypothetical protein
MIDGILQKNDKKGEERHDLKRLASFLHKDIKADNYKN